MLNMANEENLTPPSIQLGNRVISTDSYPYIIAEIGVNHEGSLDLARHLIDLAKEGGADAAKFQSYKAETLASKNSPSYWDTTKEETRSQYDLFKKYDCFNEKEYVALAEHCKKVGIDFLSTPFDDLAVEFLDPLCPFFKIASADLTNIPLLRKIASKGKPVILSTGASLIDEIKVALNTLQSAGCNNVGLLHCILNYPTENGNAHLNMIKGLQKTFPNYVIGYSDHTLPNDDMTSLVCAHLLGAAVLEKHFTYDKNLRGNDHYHAMDVNDLKKCIDVLKRTRDLLGNIKNKEPIPSENIARLNARRSIVAKKDLPIGHILTERDLICKRPGTGIESMHWDRVIGAKLIRMIEEDDVLQWKDLKV